jgi:hypothetical protein
MFNLINYVTPSRTINGFPEQSIYKNIPIEHLELVRVLMKVMGVPYRFRFRGPRATNPLDFRSRNQKQSYITKQFATNFAVYRYGR